MRKPIDDQQNDDLGALHELVDAARDDMPTDVQWQTARRNLDLRLQAGQKESIIMIIIRSAFSHKIRWAVSAVVVVLIVAFVIGLNPFEKNSAGVYAAVVEQLKKARTMVYKVTTNGADPAVAAEVTYKEPGHLKIITRAVGGYTVVDQERGMAITVLPFKKQYLELNLSALPAQKSPMSQFDEMRNLPERAQELPEKKVVDGRTCKGFQITEQGMTKTMWVDASTNDLVKMEGNFANAPGAQVVVSDFRFGVDLDDSIFNMTPPEGYQKLNITIPAQEPTENDLVSFLRIWSTDIVSDQFPDNLNLVDYVNKIKELGNSGKLKWQNDTSLTDEQRAQKGLNLTFGLTFVTKLKSENDWHYAGKGAKLGEADKAIFWYRPTGSQNYHVIYGDLSVREVTPDKLPTAVPNAQSSATPAGFPTPPVEMNPGAAANPLQPGAQIAP